jgi:hypothetical protein
MLNKLLQWRNEKGLPFGNPFEYLNFDENSIQLCYVITLHFIFQLIKLLVTVRYTVSLGVVVPELSKSNLELLANMAQHRILCASLIGTILDRGLEY